MPLIKRNRIEPMLLVIIAMALFVAAFFSYSDRPVTNSIPDDSSMPGWAHVVIFILMGSWSGLVILALAERDTRKILNVMHHERPNQPMKPTALRRVNFSVFATTPCRGLSLSR